MTENAFAIFKRRFPGDLERPFLIRPEGAETSYASLIETAGRYAAALRQLGVTKGDRVAVQVEKSPNAVFLYLGCLQIGAVYLPLNTAYKADEIAYFLGDAEPRAFLVRPETLDSLRPVAEAAGVAELHAMDAAGGGSLTDLAESLAPLNEIADCDADDLAAILYTSGTTGRSKGAMITHGNLSSNALALKEIWHFGPEDVLLHALPIFHVHGLFVAINTTLVTGSAMIFLPRFDADEVLAHLPRATAMMGVPTFYVRLLKHPGFTREASAHMRLFVAGSAPLLAQTFDAFEARTGQRILERYGMTEAGMITSNPYDQERRAGTVGFPLPKVEVRVADEDGRILGAEEVGVLEVRGPNVFKGYWRMPEKTASEFREDGFFITGDMAMIDARGYVHIVGRSKDLVISGGYNVYPKEIEVLLDGLEGVRESAVIGLPHPDFGEAVTAVVIGERPMQEEAVIAAVKDRLANFKVPKRVFFVEELPRNAMGKVQKNALRETFKQTFLAVS